MPQYICFSCNPLLECRIGAWIPPFIATSNYCWFAFVCLSFFFNNNTLLKPYFTISGFIYNLNDTLHTMSVTLCLYSCRLEHIEFLNSSFWWIRNIVLLASPSAARGRSGSVFVLSREWRGFAARSDDPCFLLMLPFAFRWCSDICKLKGDRHFAVMDRRWTCTLHNTPIRRTQTDNLHQKWLRSTQTGFVLLIEMSPFTYCNEISL